MSDQPANKSQLPLPDLGDVFFLSLIYFVIFLRPEYLFQDGSLGWHLVTGNYIIENHRLPRFDLISYTFSNKPWVAYEWLSDVFMAAIAKLGGLNLLAVLGASALGLLFLLLYKRCRKQGAHYLFVAALVFLAELLSSIHWLLRPHLVTFFGVFLFTCTLDDFYRGNIKVSRIVLLLPLFMLVWVNCHPAFLLGLVILLIYFLSALTQFLLIDGQSSEMEKKAYLDRVKGIGLSLVATAVATLVNPYFFNLYLYIIQYLRGNAVLAVTDEFKSPVFHGDIQPVCLEILLLLLATSLAITKKPLVLPAIVTAFAFAHLSLSGQRNMPLFGIVAVPLIAYLCQKTIWSADQTAFRSLAQPVKRLIAKLDDMNEQFTANELRCQMHILPYGMFLVLAAIAFNGGKFLGVDISKAKFSESRMPTSTLVEIERLKLDAKQGFNLDNWGGYIRYKSGMPVFIDDRADFYGEPFYAEYGIVCEGLPGWDKVLAKYGIHWVLFPNQSTLSYILKQRPEWKLVAKDDAASLFVLQKENRLEEAR